MGDRRAHVRVTQLGQHGTVDIRHHRMDHALRVDQHFDLLGRRAEQPVRLDYLQPLVHHGGRIDGNLAPHGPGRMLAGLVRRNLVERLDVAREEGAAGSRQHDFCHASGAWRATMGVRHALEDGVMLTVDGQQHGAVIVHGIDEQLARHDQRLLIGQQYFLASTCRRQGRRQACCANDGRHHARHLRRAGNGAQGLHAVLDLRINALPAQQPRQFKSGFRSADDSALRTELQTLGGQFGHAAVCTQRIHAVLLGMTREHVQGRHADRAGRAKDSDVLHEFP